MTALTQDRNTSRRDGNQVEPPVAATTRTYVGAMVAITAAGLAVPGATSTTLKCVGSALSPADNTLGAAGAIRVKVDKRPARFANSAAADAITLADIGNTAYIADDSTVAKTDNSGARKAAGKIIYVDAAGVWVLVG